MNVYDVAYALGVGISAPFWLLKPSARRKVFSAFSRRMGHVSRREGNAPAVMIHAVSLGEINAARGLVDRLRQLRPDMQLIISVTTETGFARAMELWGKEVGAGHAPPSVSRKMGKEAMERPVGAGHAPPSKGNREAAEKEGSEARRHEGTKGANVGAPLSTLDSSLSTSSPPQHSVLLRYPLDFSPAVARVLDGLRPSLVVLMELEAWPNFILQCSRRGIPVILVNGRMTAPSCRRYRWALPVMRRLFHRMASLCVQDQTNAQRFASLGAPSDRIQVTGTMKFDTATVADSVPGDADLARDLSLDAETRTQNSELKTSSNSALPIAQHWICGSTGPGEEQIILEQYRRLLHRFPELRLCIIPRKPERFDEVAQLITAAGFPLLRRSHVRDKIPGGSEPTSVAAGQAAPVILGDTMGELRKFYSLADVVFVGRTLVDLGPRQHGSDMIEPAALGKPVIVGPYTGNFADAMDRFRAAGALREVSSGAELGDAVARLLSDRAAALDMARRARQVVVSEKGATERHVEVILRYLPLGAERVPRL